jgi:phosphoribosyl-AMP cyclohydrolase
VLLKVRVAGDAVACHTGYRSCFYRSVPLGSEPSPETRLSFDETMKRIPPGGEES